MVGRILERQEGWRRPAASCCRLPAAISAGLFIFFGIPFFFRGNKCERRATVNDNNLTT